MSGISYARKQRQDEIKEFLPAWGANEKGKTADRVIVFLKENLNCADLGNSEHAILRSIQRELKDLCEDGAIEAVNPNGKPLRYRRTSQDNHDEEFTVALGIAAVLTAPQREKILDIVKIRHAHQLIESDKLRFIPDALRLNPAKIQKDVLTSVLRALALDRKLDMTYQKADGTTKRYDLHPQAIIHRGPALYLYACKEGLPNVQLFAMHRIISITVVDNPCVRNDGFNIEEMIKSGEADFGNGEQIKLEALVGGYVADLLYECPLAAKQTLDSEDEGAPFKAKLTVELPDTGNLYRWILGCGQHIQVLGPPKLRNMIAAAARNTNALYVNPA